jgi:hypothetical protein
MEIVLLVNVQVQTIDAYFKVYGIEADIDHYLG